MLRRWVCQADLEVEIEPIDPVLIKSGYATLDGPDMVPVSTLRNGKTVYYFPGTSLKGVFRSHFERIARTLAPGSVCIPYYDPKRQADLRPPVDSEAESFGCGFREAGGGRPDNSATAYLESCPACRMFGSLRFAGRLSFSDAFPLAGKEPVASTRTGIGIDRFTGGVVKNVLFELLALEGGAFLTHVRLVNFEQWQLAALHMLLEDLESEMIALGSGRSRGFGRVRGTVRKYQLFYISSTPSFLALWELATEAERKAYGLCEWHPPEPIPLPEGVRRGIRWCYDLSADWADRMRPLAGSLESCLSRQRPLGTVSGRIGIGG
jgi:CRISPR/Cas system CSM-associated protein Csm3 (group 7 of RAMP superfamily)